MPRCPIHSCEITVVPGVPFSLVPSSAGLWRVDEAVGAVTVTAQPHSDIFIDERIADLRDGS
jgi:hypothetical protein